MKTYRTSFYIALGLIYFTPLFLVAKVLEPSAQIFCGLGLWTLLGFGILLYFIFFIEKKMKKDASILVSSRIYQIENNIFSQTKSANPVVDLKKVSLLTRELDEQGRREKTFLVEIERLKKLQVHQEREFGRLNEELHNQLDKNETILSEYRFTLKEQRKIIEKKQKEMNILQIRVNDLKYEVESLLKLKGADPVDKELFSNLKKEEEGSDLKEVQSGLMDSIQVKLDRYVKMAMRLNGARHFANKDFKYSDLSLGSLIIDQRRLFDRLQNEEHETIMVYSREEKRLVFINQQIKELLGWGPERFLKDFSFFIQKGENNWLEALEDVKLDQQKSIRLLMKARSGRDVLTHCYLKEIPEGVFRGYILGILSSATAVS